MQRSAGNLLRLITRDPTGAGELIVTRLEGLDSGVVIEGRFSLGWIGLLTPDQLDFVGLLLANRGNVQRVASDLGVSYNTARSRMDDVVIALGAPPDTEERESRAEILNRLAAGEIEYDEAMELIGQRS